MGSWCALNNVCWWNNTTMLPPPGRSALIINFFRDCFHRGDVMGMDKFILHTAKTLVDSAMGRIRRNL